MTTKAVERAVEPRDIVRALRAFGITQDDIARVAGVSTRAVRAWNAAGGIRDPHFERLQDLRDIVLELQDSLTNRGVGQWFRARNRLLGGRRPLDALSAGDVEAVRQAARAFADGAYV